jgi:hypothetical protein
MIPFSYSLIYIPYLYPLIQLDLADWGLFSVVYISLIHLLFILLMAYLDKFKGFFSYVFLGTFSFFGLNFLIWLVFVFLVA